MIKALVAKIHEFILLVNRSQHLHYRFERAFHNEDLYGNGQGGWPHHIAIRSTIVDLMSKIDRQKAFKDWKRTTTTRTQTNDYRFIEYRFLSSRTWTSQPASEVYADQEEELVAGTYRIVKIENKARRYGEFRRNSLISYARACGREA